MEQQIINNRNHGIDALRIISMFMVVLLHTLGQGGILHSVNNFSGKYYVAWLIETAAFCAVNCYALVSGYVGIHSRRRYSKIVSLWAQIIFYTLIITSCFAVLRPGTVNSNIWLRAVLPITKSHYWYLTSYFGLFFMMPLLNAAVNNLSKKELMKFLIAVIIIFSLIPTVLQSDPYEMEFGYSLIWLCILYVLGGFIKRYDMFASVGKMKALMIYILCILTTWGSKIMIAKLTLKVYGKVLYTDTLLRYNSPTMLIAAIALLIFFAKLKLEAPVIKKLIGFLAPASLGVYIIHTNILIWNYYIYDYAKQFINCHAILMAIKVVCASLAIYLCCSLVEHIRMKLFQVLRIDKLITKIDKISNNNSIKRIQ